MAAKKILGTYINSAFFSDSYTFTGNDRAAEIVPASQKFAMQTLNCEFSLQTCFKFDGILHIKKARIITPGAPGLQPPPSKYAAELTMQLLDGFDNELTSWRMILSKFNEWQDLDQNITPYEKNGVKNNPSQFVYLGLNSYNSYINIDDFNIQEDYVGQTFKPCLQMIVDTAGQQTNNGIEF